MGPDGPGWARMNPDGPEWTRIDPDGPELLPAPLQSIFSDWEPFYWDRCLSFSLRFEPIWWQVASIEMFALIGC